MAEKRSSSRRRHSNAMTQQGEAYGGQYRLSFHRLSLPNFQPAIQGQISATLQLVKIVAEFTEQAAHLYCTMGLQLEELLDGYQRKSELLAGPQSCFQSCSASVLDAWFALLKQMHEEAKTYLRLSAELTSSVQAPLSDLSSHKADQSAKIFTLRAKMEALADESAAECQERLEDFNKKYASYANESRNTARMVSDLLNSHNRYVLSLHAVNRIRQEVHLGNFPGMLQELEEIEIDAVNMLNSALVSHCYLRMSTMDTIKSRFESVLPQCKRVTPQKDAEQFVRFCISSGGGGDGSGSREFELETYQPDCLGESDFVLKNELVVDRLTVRELKQQQQQLLNEIQGLRSFIRQNEEVTESLKTFCQRNLGSHLYSKVYETQEDLSRKRNEIRMASVQLAGLQAQMDLMNFKKQDSFGCEEGGGPDYGYCIGAGAIGGSGAGGSGGPGGPAGCGGAGGGVGGGGACGGGGSVGDKQGDASIKGLWRRAFNILKTKDKDKEKAKKKRGGKEDEDGADVDPVYSLLKRAADKGVQKCSGCTGPMTGTSPRASDASLFSASPVSLSSSWLPPPPPQPPPCNPSTCECLCHRVQLIPCITLNDLKPKPKHHHNHHLVKLRSKSLSADVERVDELQQQQQHSRLQKQLSEDEEQQQQQQQLQEPVWGGRGRISATFETRWSRLSQPHSLPE